MKAVNTLNKKEVGNSAVDLNETSISVKSNDEKQRQKLNGNEPVMFI